MIRFFALAAALTIAVMGCSETAQPGAPAPGTGGASSAGSGGLGAGGGVVASGGAGAVMPPCAGGASAQGGSSGVAGASGGNASGGAATASGGAGTAGGGPLPPKPSAGCKKVPTDAPGQFVKHSLMSSGKSRDFYTYLPVGYDPSKAYPTVFEFHPCGGSGNPSSNVPIQNESKGNAILILPQSAGNCYENQIRNSPDVTFFDDALKNAEDDYCVDEARVFALGYSAGSWMSIILGCERSDVVRAHAQVSGGLPMFIRPGVDCHGNVAALFIHDGQDPTNTILGGIAARDRVLREDRCDTATSAWAPAPCQAYQGCKAGYPVVWCQTTGQGHGRQDNLAPAAIWKFFSQF